jgi:SulP family sulfate permease
MAGQLDEVVTGLQHAPGAARSRLRLPLLQSVLPIDSARVPLDIVAGVTLAALAIPEVIGYTSIADMPVVTGLYTLLLPIAVFALVGSSRHLVVGADSATAAIPAAGLVGLATAQSATYVALASLAALITAGWLLLARVIGLGFLADFLSRAVMIGFLTGVGIRVAAAQLSGMLGVPENGTGTIETTLAALSQLDQTNIPTLLVSVAVLVVIVGLRMVARRIPGPLIAVIGGILASSAFNLAAYGVAAVGHISGGLPAIGWPAVSWTTTSQLLTTTISLCVVILAQSAATSRAYAARYDEPFDENSDLLGLALANAAAGLSGTFVVNGSPTKTQIVDSAGGRTQLAQLTCAVVVLAVLLFLTGPLALMPTAVLAAIVFLIGIELVDIRGMRAILMMRPREFWVALLTALVVVLVGVEQAIIVAMAASLISHVRRGYDPQNTVLMRTAGAHGSRIHWHSQPVATGGQALPGLVIYRFTHAVYYANADRFSRETLELIKRGPVPTRCLCVDCSAIDDVDFTAGEVLLQVAHTLKSKGVRLVFADANDHVRRELERSGVTQVVGADAYFEDLGAVLDQLGEDT